MLDTPAATTPRKVSLLAGAIFGFVITAAASAVFFLGNIFVTLPQPYLELFDRVARLIPGALITFGIDTMVAIFSRIPGVATDQASKAAEQALAVILFLILGAVFGMLVAAFCRAARRAPGAYLGAGLALIPAVGLLLLERFNTGAPNGPFTTSVWVLFVVVVAGMVIGTLLEAHASIKPKLVPDATPSDVPLNRARRRFLLQTSGSAAAVAIAGYGLGRLLYGQNTGVSGAAVASGGSGMPTATPMPANAPAGGFVAVPGTRLEVTPNDQFYRVDINTVVPTFDPAQWRLTVAGEVDGAFIINYDELLKLPSVEMDATLECISNPVGGGLISSTRWKGVTLKSILEKAKIRSNVKEIKFYSFDGYTESLPLESAMDERTLLAYATNGEPLRSEHGAPLRLFTPNRYGMKNPKWIEKIEAIPDTHNGYWEDRGWNKDAFVKSTSIIDVIAVENAKDMTVPVGGIAFAGSRGIAKVEVSADGGEWQPVTLKEPLAPLTWVLWRYDWVATKGYHTLTVRCTDGKGALQIQQEAPLHPDGASGYVSQSKMV